MTRAEPTTSTVLKVALLVSRQCVSGPLSENLGAWLRQVVWS
jgi:hypothetical protein